GDRARSRKPLRVNRRVAKDIGGQIKERYLIAVGTEEKETAELAKVDIIGTDLHVVTANNPVEVIPHLVFPNEGLLRDIHVLADFYLGGTAAAAHRLQEANLRISRHAVRGLNSESACGCRRDGVHEILKLQRYRVDFIRCQNVVVRHDHAVKLI